MFARHPPECITVKASISTTCSVQSTRITQRKEQVVSVAVRDRSSMCSISLSQYRYFYALTRERQLRLYHHRGSGPRQEAAPPALRMKVQRRSQSTTGSPRRHCATGMVWCAGDRSAKRCGRVIQHRVPNMGTISLKPFSDTTRCGLKRTLLSAPVPS